MFRTHPTVVVDLLHGLGVDVPPYATIHFGDPALGQVKPTTLAADLVIELCDAAGRPVLATILEVQLTPEDRKLATWPAYLTTHRERRGCDTCILVLTPSREVAAWARRSIRLGPGNPEFRVLSLGPDEVPLVTESAEAVANPTLAALSAITRGNDPEGVAVLTAALEALAVIDSTTAKVYLHLIVKALTEPRRRALEDLIMLREIAERIPDPIFPRLADLREQKARNRSVLRVLEVRRVALTPEQYEQIRVCMDPEQTDIWLERAATANSAADLFFDADPK